MIWILFGKDYASFKMGSAWAKGIQQEVKGQCKEGKEEEEEGEEMEEEEEEGEEGEGEHALRGAGGAPGVAGGPRPAAARRGGDGPSG